MGRAPGRVNLIGEHTDYNAGLCLPLALSYATTVRATVRVDRAVSVRSAQVDEPWTGTLDDVGPGQVEGWASYAVGVLWALRESGWEVPGVDLEVDSTVPMGAGLSSSAALECAVAVAVADLLDHDLTPELRRTLVEACRRAESEVAGAPTGGLDQTVSLLASPGSALLIDFRDGSTRDVPLGWDDAGLRLLVVDTRVSHALVDGGYAARRADCEAATAALGLPSLREATLADLDRVEHPRERGRARHVVTENARVEEAVVAIGELDWTRLGTLMTASHVSLRDDFEVSCHELDLVVDTALQAGALGARMTGGGFGGSAIALVPAERADAVARAVDLAFVAAGLGAVHHLDAVPSGPAGIVA
ncbi:galactokinase [Nocardioides psychrotolerans]|uniref:Galactokinase n=1 Tax=Nocardioides psychrotolerans TaxID=1005945 RepID=A0A1I3JXL4_9ACTN|nr:galactokinase [Nocardioides psychrotolerans]SFI64971.1 galactokinase [Nocardioides psychrotolerans]